MKSMCIVFFLIGLFSFIINLILKIIRWFKEKDQKYDLFDIIVNSLFNKISFISFMIAIILYIAFSLIPYLLNEKDAYLINSYKMNISLYEEYIKEYQTAARKQIEEYQAAQSAMAKTATSIQLQYFNQQIDAVANSITERIKEFNDAILKQKIEINLATARITARKSNKFYFY